MSLRSKAGPAANSSVTNTSSSPTSAKDKEKMSSIFSVFSQSLSRKASDARLSFTTASSTEPSPTDVQFPLPPSASKTSNRQSGGSQFSTSQLQIPNTESRSGPDSFGNSPEISSPTNTSPASRLNKSKPLPKPLISPTASFPSLDTQTRVSPTSIPSQKFLSQMSLSLALRTATIQTQLPVIRPAITAPTPQGSKIKRRFFGGSTKPPRSTNEYELVGRSTFALVHGAILRYHSEFGDDINTDAIPNNTHFLNGSSVICVTDAIQGFKWVLEVKTWAKGGLIKSPMKRSKSTQKLVEKNIDLTRLPWGIMDGIQAWYLVFETASSMTEWMITLRATVVSIREKEAKAEKAFPRGTPKTTSRTSSKPLSKEREKTRSPQPNSPTSSLDESLPSSPSSSRTSFAILSQRGSVAEEVDSKRLSGGSLDNSQPRRRRSSQQDIAVTAFRISSFEEDLEGFVLPDQSITERRMPPKNPDTESSRSAVPVLTPNFTHYSNKRDSIVSVQSRLSSLSSGPRTPLPHPTVSPTASPGQPRSRRTVRRTHSGELSNPNNSWKQHQNNPPPYPPPSGPLPIPPPLIAQCNYIAAAQRGSSVFDQRESLILGISPLFETETPKTFLEATPRTSPDAVGLSHSSMDAPSPEMDSMAIRVLVS